MRTNPAGVKVFLREELLGVSPVEVPRVRSGDVEVELRGDGFTDLIIEGDVKENEMLELFADMEKRRGVTFGREWRNPTGIKFIPLGDILLAATETRRRDYLKFVKAINGRRPMNAPEQSNKAAQMPVVGVDREEARAFCAWLTKREREADWIGKTDRYRLPTDEEWSRAVGLPLERGKDPAERNGRIRGVYPWGYEWPPPRAVDNFADESASRMATTSKTIHGYHGQVPGSGRGQRRDARAQGTSRARGQCQRVGGHGFRARPESQAARPRHGPRRQLAQHERGRIAFVSKAGRAGYKPARHHRFSSGPDSWWSRGKDSLEVRLRERDARSIGGVDHDPANDASVRARSWI